MSNKTKPVHNVTVRIKVFADTKQEAESFVTRYLRVAGEGCVENEPLTFNAIKHWQIKQ